MTLALDRFFHIRERGSSVSTELRAGLVTFLTMAYILVVNPQVLSAAGMPAEDVTIATALGSALGTLMMGLVANYPFALAPSMGLNAYFTYGVVRGLGVTWQIALTAVFVEGLIFLALSFGGVRTALIQSIPSSVKLAISTGIGLFLALIGFRNAGLVVSNEATLVGLGSLHAGAALVTLFGILLIAALTVRKVKGAILLGIAACTALAWVTGLAPPPRGILSVPHLPRTTLFAFDFSVLLTAKFASVVLAFLFVEIFDTAGTLLGVARVGRFLDARGELPNSDRAFVADALGTTAGAVLGTSTVSAYIESAAGVEEGGRTGLTAVAVSGLFLLSLFCIPLLAAIPAMATAPALIIVGALMMGSVAEIEWRKLDEAIPAFLTLAVMPFTFSVSNGITFGLVSYAAIKLLTGKWREPKPMLYGIATLLVLYRAFSG